MTNKETIEKLLAMKKCGGLTNEYRQALNLAIQALEERPQGEWILQTHERFNSGNELYKYYCNKCGHKEEHAYSNSKLPNFCPNCGADMRKGEKSEDSD